MESGGAGKSKGFQDERYRALIQFLVARRNELGLSQARLAERIGNHQQFVGRYETGERRLDVIEFADIARALELDPSELLRLFAG
jgi:transcriptional regulator with XRE-family HTH domain